RQATLDERVEAEQEGAQPMDQPFIANSPEDTGIEATLHPMRGFSGSNPRRESPPCVVCGVRHGKRMAGTVGPDEVVWKDGRWQRKLTQRPVGWAESLKRRNAQSGEARS